MPRFICSIRAALLALCLVLAGYAQSIDGRIMGTVVDASNAGIPGAEVSATNQSTGVAWKSQTDQSGNYIFAALPPGVYTVKVQAAGFRVASAVSNTVGVAQTIRVDVKLEVGGVSESIEVRAVAALVQSATSDIGEVIEQRQVQTLPLNGRIFSQLVQLVPGAIGRGQGDAPEASAGAGARTAITSSVNGVPWSGTSYTVDGVANSEPLNAFINIAPPLEAVEEFKVQTSNPSAEFGIFGGAVVNLTLRSGGNEIHGSAFEYLRNQTLNARSFFAAGKAPFKSNQFGGTLGGPIKKNKAFLFGDYQGLRLRKGSTYTMDVPTAAMRQGKLLAEEGFDTIYDPLSSSSTAGVTPFAGNEIPQSRWDAVTRQVLPLWPDPNHTPSTPGPYSNYIQNVSNSQRMDAFDIKGDYVFERYGRVFIRESYSNRYLNTVPPGNRWMYSEPDSDARSHNAVFGYSAAFRPNLLNELRLGFNRFATFHSGQDYGVDKNNELGIRNGNLAAFPESSGIANFAVDHLYGFGADGWTNALRLADTFELTDGLTWVRGSHTLKLGGDVRRIRSTLTNPEGSGRGEFGFDNNITSLEGSGGDAFASFLLGYSSYVYRGLVNTRPDVRMVQGGFYAQDDWRASRALTVNLGVRWDIFTHPVENYNRQVNFNPTTGKFNAASSGNRGPNVDTYLGNVSPRAGFAYSPNNGKLAIRGAVGVSHFGANYGASGGTLERNYPLFQTFYQSASNVYEPFLSVAQDGLPAFVPTALAAEIDPAPGIEAMYMPQNFRPVTVIMWNIGVQQQLGAASAVEAAYVATRATQLYRNRGINTPYTPAAGDINLRRPYYAISPNTESINERASDGASRYNSLQLKFTRRFASGFQGLFSYTYADSKDNTSIFWVWDDTMNWLPSTNQSLDLRHTFSGSWTYELPFGKNRRFLSGASGFFEAVAGGWSINGISSLRTGAPLAVYVKSNLLNTGTSNWANRTCSDVGYPKTVAKWFDTSCFDDPAERYVFGDAKTGSVRGPGVVNFDLSAFKAFRFAETKSVEFRAEFFNALNTPHFSSPSTSRSSSNFGRITSTTLTPREIQLGLKLMF